MCSLWLLVFLLYFNGNERALCNVSNLESVCWTVTVPRPEGAKSACTKARKPKQRYEMKQGRKIVAKLHRTVSSTCRYTRLIWEADLGEGEIKTKQNTHTRIVTLLKLYFGDF